MSMQKWLLRSGLGLSAFFLVLAGGLWVALETDVDQQRHRLGRALEVASEDDRRAKLTECPCPGDHHPREEGGCDQWQCDALEDLASCRAIDGSRLFDLSAYLCQRDDGTAHVEWSRDEDLCQHHCQRGEGYLHTTNAEQMPERSLAPERDQQRDTRDSRG